MGNITQKQGSGIPCLRKELSSNDQFSRADEIMSKTCERNEPIVVYFLPKEIYEKNTHFRQRMAIKYNLNSMCIKYFKHLNFQVIHLKLIRQMYSEYIIKDLPRHKLRHKHGYQWENLSNQI